MIVIVMGVSGCGKTSVGKTLAVQLGWRFIDADDYHPASNIEKMASGIPLDDRDRKPWLETLHDLMAAAQHRGESMVLACSALKQSYRDRLSEGIDPLTWVYLRGSYEQLLGRIEDRKGHFMKAALLKTQFDTLEEPASALVIDAKLSITEQVTIICDMIT